MIFTDVFWAIRNSPEKILILQGGTSSSKTYSSIQDAFLYCIYNKNKIYTVTGESIPNLKKGAYRDAETIFSNYTWVENQVQDWNKTDRIINFKSGSKLEFISNLDAQSAKAGKRDRLFIDETNGVPYPIFFQLAIRTKDQIILAYNPTAPFWVHEKLIGTGPGSNDLNASVKLLITDHRHNTTLSKDEHDKIENIKDPELWRVYARGLTGNLTGLIFPNWVRIPDSQYPHDNDFYFGLDFGYTNDPTAIVKIVKIGESVFFHEICYEPGIPPKMLNQLLRSNGCTDNTDIFCDHDPDMVRDLRAFDLYVLPARKGTGWKKAAIHKLNECKVFYTESSKNLHEERIRYMWMMDKDTGKPTNTPEDGFDHAIDAGLMGFHTRYVRGG
jgi:phage terminase large subunit